MATPPTGLSAEAVRFAAHQRYAHVAAGACVAIGLGSLAGWAFHLEALTEVFSGLVSMKPNTALGFILGGVALFSSVREPVSPARRRTAQAAAGALSLLGFATCAEYLFSWDLGIDQLLFHDPGTRLRVGPPGRMSPLTAINFATLGAALLVLDLPRARRTVNILCIVTLLSAGLVLAGYLYHVSVLFAVWTYLAVALHTAIGLVLLSSGILAARSDRGLLRVVTAETAGGLMARRLLPAALLLPPFLGWLRLQGEQAGYYDSTFGLALFASSNVVVFSTLVFWNAHSLARLDEARRAQVDHLRLVIEHSPAGVAMFDRDMRYLLVSPRWLKDYGLRGRELLGKSHYEIFPDLPEDWKEVHRRCLAGGTARKDEDPFPRADGSVDWVRWEICPWREPRGEIGGILIFSELITERKRAEERFQATFEQAAVGIAHVDPAGRILRANRKLCEILGYPREELVARTLHELTHPDDLPAAQAQIRGLLEGTIEIYSLEKRFLRKEGGVVWTNLTRSLVRQASGAPDYFITVIEDISRRKEAEELLRQAQARLTSLSDANLIGIVVTTLEGKLLDANAALLSMLGYTKEELSAGTLPWADVTPPEYRPVREKSLAELRAGGRLTPRERDFVRKDGSRVSALVGGSRIQGAGDAAVFFVLDLSERKLLEDQLRQAQRMEVVGRLAGGVAHDFNNLLTPILGYCDLGLEHLEASHPLREDLQEIRRSAERAAVLTRQLLAFSRKQVLQPRVLDLNVLIGDAAKLLRRLIGEDIELQLTLAPELPRVRVDPGQMEQVLMNLAVNARDAMPGGGRLTIETAAADLDQTYASQHPEVTPGRHVLVSVSDTGTGMTKEVKARLFEPFFTTKDQGKGTGLGLATVHGIVKQSHGHIWVYSEPGRGTTFKVYLPEERGAAEPAAAAPGKTSVERGTETLLLVEDDESLRSFAARVLRSKGYTVLEARSGEHAMQLSKSHAGSVDLLLTDVVMPGMSGRETARQLLASRPRMRVLYMSGYTENAIVHHGVLDEGTSLLEKPFTPDALLRKLRAVLDARRE